MVTTMVNLRKGNKHYERGAPGRVARGFIIEQLPKRILVKNILVAHIYSPSQHSHTQTVLLILL